MAHKFTLIRKFEVELETPSKKQAREVLRLARRQGAEDDYLVTESVYEAKDPSKAKEHPWLNGFKNQLLGSTD